MLMILFTQDTIGRNANNINNNELSLCIKNKDYYFFFKRFVDVSNSTDFARLDCDSSVRVLAYILHNEG